jgi:cytochrome c biogenesis factor
MFWLWLGGALIIAGSALAVVEGRTGRQPMAE